jgi:hypothetical protein
MSAGSPSFPINSFQIGSGPAAAYFQSVAQSIATSVNATLNFQIKEFDTDNAFDINTGIFLPKVAGIYQINAAVRAAGFTAAEANIAIAKNNVEFKRGVSNNSTNLSCTVSSLIILNGNDYIQIRTFQATGAAVTTTAGASLTYFNAAWIRGL